MEEIKEFSTSSLITRTTNDITNIEMFLSMSMIVLIKAPITAVWAVLKILNKNLVWSMITGIAVLVLLITIGYLTNTNINYITYEPVVYIVEDEYRNINHSYGKPKFNKVGNVIKPYMVYPIPVTAISSITIGPCNKNSDIVKGLVRFIKTKLGNNFVIKYSKNSQIFLFTPCILRLKYYI